MKSVKRYTLFVILTVLFWAVVIICDGVVYPALAGNLGGIGARSLYIFAEMALLVVFAVCDRAIFAGYDGQGLFVCKTVLGCVFPLFWACVWVFGGIASPIQNRLEPAAFFSVYCLITGIAGLVQKGKDAGQSRAST